MKIREERKYEMRRSATVRGSERYLTTWSRKRKKRKEGRGAIVRRLKKTRGRGGAERRGQSSLFLEKRVKRGRKRRNRKEGREGERYRLRTMP